MVENKKEKNKEVSKELLSGEEIIQICDWVRGEDGVCEVVPVDRIIRHTHHESIVPVSPASNE